MAKDGKLDLVIVNWNSGKQLQKCLTSILEYGDQYVGRIVIIDNGSSDGSEDEVEELPLCILIRTGENLGFAKACNIGANYTDAELILFLNPDGCIFKNTIKDLMSFMGKPENQQIGICGVQLLNEQGSVSRHCTMFPTFSRFLAHSVGLSRLFPKTGYVLSGWDHQETKEVDHVIGAFYLVRRQVFEDLNGFDERFFMYMEDLDFSYRANQKGWERYYLANTQAFHAGGGSSRHVKAKRLYYSLRSRLLYAFKHLPSWQAWLLVISTCLLEPLMRALLCVVKRKWGALSELYSAYRKLFTQLPSDFKQYWRN